MELTLKRPKISLWFYNESGSKISQEINGLWAQFSQSYRFSVTTMVGKTMPLPNVLVLSLEFVEPYSTWQTGLI